jgi:hypothetical protein
MKTLFSIVSGRSNTGALLHNFNNAHTWLFAQTYISQQIKVISFQLGCAFDRLDASDAHSNPSINFIEPRPTKANFRAVDGSGRGQYTGVALRPHCSDQFNHLPVVWKKTFF